MPQAKYWKNKIGYVPCDKDNEAVAKALEYAYDDWCISVLAGEQGDAANQQKYAEFGKGYKHYFDPSTRFMRGLDSEGNWRTPFNPRSSNHRSDDYCEGTAWQWTWFVPHDVEGLVDLMGGREAFIGKLDSLFTANSALEGELVSADISGLIGQYAHGNEPSHHIAYLYTYAGEQWKTAEKVRFIMSDFYTAQPDGIIGNEDCGQMSAWYLLSAMGFYLVNPADGVFAFGSPRFKKIEVKVRGGKVFTVEAPNNSKDNIYIQKVYLNGKPYHKSYITYDDIINGSTLKFEKGKKPAEFW